MTHGLWLWVSKANPLVMTVQTEECEEGGDFYCRPLTETELLRDGYYLVRLYGLLRKYGL